MSHLQCARRLPTAAATQKSITRSSIYFDGVRGRVCRWGSTSGPAPSDPTATQPQRKRVSKSVIDKYPTKRARFDYVNKANDYDNFNEGLFEYHSDILCIILIMI